MANGSLDEIISRPAREQAKLIADRAVSPVELCEATLERIERLDGKIGAFITVAAEQALAAAKAAESAVMSGKPLGPLHGVPIGIKDIEATAGIRTTVGSRVFANTVPDFDSVVVERVRAAGAVIVGKTNTPEIAIHMGTITDNDVHGPCNNPWDLTAPPPALPAARRRRWRPTCCRWLSAATVAAPSASRHRSAVSTASSRAMAASREHAASVGPTRTSSRSPAR